MGLLLKALSLLKYVTLFKWLTPLVGLTNPVVGFLLGAVGWVFSILKTVVKGTLSFLTNPVETVAVFVLCALTLIGGVVLGIKFMEHRVETFKTQLADLQKAMGKHDYDDAQKAAAAVKARREAEAAMRAQLEAEAAARRKPAPLSLIQAPAVVAADTAVPAGKPKRVRNNKVRADKPQQSLQGSFSSDWTKTFGSIKW